MQSWFVKWLVGNQEWPHALAGIVPRKSSANEAYIEPFMTLMRHKKGDDYLTLFFDQCQAGHMPASIVHTLRSLREMVERPAVHPVLPLPLHCAAGGMANVRERNGHCSLRSTAAPSRD